MRFLFARPVGAELPREGSNLADNLRHAEDLAAHLGIEARFVRIENPGQLIPALEEGIGDIIGTLLQPTDRHSGVIFTTPLKHVEHVLVIRRGMREPPQSLDELAERRIHMPALPGTETAIARVEKILGQKLNVTTVHESYDTLDMLDRLGSGQYDLTIARSDLVDDYLAYRDDVEIAFVLEERVPITWAVSDAARELLDSMNGFVYEYAMTPHRRSQFGGDLADIRKRDVLRVAMLNNSVAYFIYRGQEVGFQYELADLLSRRIDVRLEIVVPELPKDASRMLVENRADLAVVSPDPQGPYSDRIAYSKPFHSSDQVLVQPAGEKPIGSLVELIGKEIHVRRSSQYYSTLQAISWILPDVEIVHAPEELETEDLIDAVAKRKIPLTVANSVLLNTELNYRDDVQASLVLARNMPLVFAVRKESQDLLERVNRFVREDCSGTSFDELNEKYFSGRKRMVEVRTHALDTSGAISPYDDLAKKYGRKFAIDWRLILAQMYKESRFNPRARSWAGARGLLQIMPQTARELGFSDLWNPEQNVHAGVTYLSWLMSKFEYSLPMRQRVRFALAAYNAGLGHVKDARRLAWRLGHDPNRWFGHVEEAMVLLQKPKYHRQSRHGYCRGSEPVQYVSEIQTKYDAYVRLMPAEGTETAPAENKGEASENVDQGIE